MILNTQDPNFITKNFEPGPLLTVPEVAILLRLKEGTVRKMILERRIDTVRPSRRAVRIPQTSVEKILKTNFRPALPEEGEGT